MKTFQELGICDEILKAITELGYENPMPVQEQVIPHLLNEETDLVALAQTGTGKTAAFGLPVIQRIDLSLCKPQALILSPTRELCLQIASDLTDYSQYVSGLRILPVYGGSSIESQIKTLKKGVHIIVATPGRLVDLIERRTVQLDHVSTVIMDEADEMLNMGFLDSINAILSKVPQERKMLLFSATMPKEIEQIARTYMHEPKEVVVGSRNEGAENVRHVYYMYMPKTNIRHSKESPTITQVYTESYSAVPVGKHKKSPTSLSPTDTMPTPSTESCHKPRGMRSCKNSD